MIGSDQADGRQPCRCAPQSSQHCWPWPRAALVRWVVCMLLETSALNPEFGLEAKVAR